MAVVKKPGKRNQKAKIPAVAYPPAALVKTVAAIDVDGKTANQACEQLMLNNPDVLAKHGVSVEDYNRKPGQVSGGVRMVVDRLVESDADMYDLAVSLGLELSNPRPGTRTSIAEEQDPVTGE